MIQAAHDGKIDLQVSGWQVGDKRTITVGAFQGAKNAHNEQQIDIAISSFGDYEGCGNVMQFDFADSLSETEQMSSKYSNSGGYSATTMYTTTLPALADALPDWLKAALITFSVKASEGASSTTIETIGNNKLALRSGIEVMDATGGMTAAGEGAGISYYTSVDNRIKKQGHSGEQAEYWLRSPQIDDSANFCSIQDNGYWGGSPALYQKCIAPFGCL